MKKKLLFAAIALTAMASCTEDSFVGEQSQQEANASEGAISFNLNTSAVTRASGATAATALSNQFVVYGEKSETDDGAAAADGKLAFKNYLVKWTDNSAYTTTSNTKNWEYVGISATTAENTNISPNSRTDAQTIKYWDYSATNYVFTAVSALPEDIQNGRVKIEKITDASSTASNKVFNKGYIIKLDKTGSDPYTYASFDKLYFSDRQVIAQGTGSDRTATNAYGGNVTLTFRNETIPGYAISDIHFFVTGDNVEAKVDETDAFGAICPNIKSSTYTEALKVTYEPSGGVMNHPIVTPVTKANTETAVTANPDLILGTNTSLVTTDAPLGTTTTAPTWDTSGGTFTPVFPQAGNTTNLKLKCNYTLYNSVSGEIINVTGATAEIPYQYLQWKPNFKYTYLFKISDNTNGSSGTPGTHPTGLYPITFDAVEIVAEDGQAEYITTVSEPSITTFGVKSGVYSTGKTDYETGTDIYATIVKNHAVVDPTSNYKVYTVTAGATEAQVAEAIAEKAIRNVTPSITCTAYTTNVSVVTTVPGEDGVDKTVTGAIKMQSPAAATYAVEYKVSDGSATATDAAYNSSTVYYSMTKTANGFYPIVTVSLDDLNEGAWKNDEAKAKYTTAPTQPVYVYKVIVVQ